MLRVIIIAIIAQSAHGAAIPPAAGETGAYQTTVTDRKPGGKDSTADKAEVAGDDLRASPAASAFEAVAGELPGVYVTSRGAGFHGVASGASGSIKMRGLGGSPNSEVLVLEDGVPDYQGLFGHPIPDAYVADLIESVEVTKGGDSVLYGTNAMGGALNFKSLWRREQGCTVNAGAALGSYGTFLERASLLGNWGLWDTAAFIHAARSDGHREGAGGDDLVGQVGARWRAGDLSITVKDKPIHLTGGDPGPVTHPFDDHWYDVFRNNASMNARYHFDAATLRLVVFHNYGETRLYDGFMGHDQVAGGTAEADIKFLDSFKLLLGGAVDSATGDARNRITGVVEKVEGTSTLAFFNQATWSPIRQVTLVAGTREGYSPAWGGIFLYKAGGTWEFYPGLSVRTRYVTNFRQPTIQERYLPYPVANPDLKPERSATLDGGLAATYGHVDFSITAYRTEARDLIKYFGSWPAAEVINIDHVTFSGIESQFAFRRVGPFSFMIGGDWQDVGRYTKQNPTRKFNAAVMFDRGPLHAAVLGEKVDGLFQNNYSRDPIPDAWHVDAAARYTIILGPERTATLSIDLRNLTDNKYEYIKDYPMPGFNALAGLDLRF